MKFNQVKIGNTYQTKVSDKLVQVKILRRHQLGGWEAKNLSTGKIIRIKTAGRLTAIVLPDPIKVETVEPVAIAVEPLKTEAAAPSTPKRSKEVHIEPISPTANYKPSPEILKLAQLLRQGATKAEILQTFGWKSWNPRTSAVLKLGYGVRSDANGQFWLIEPSANAA